VKGAVRVMVHPFGFEKSIRFQPCDGEFHEMVMDVPLPVVTGAA
jgi:hypothetical protein